MKWDCKTKFHGYELNHLYSVLIKQLWWSIHRENAYIPFFLIDFFFLEKTVTIGNDQSLGIFFPLALSICAKRQDSINVDANMGNSFDIKYVIAKVLRG